jgi:hypothetical protein
MKPRRGSAKLVQLRLVRRLASLTWLMLPVLSAVARAPWFDRGFKLLCNQLQPGHLHESGGVSPAEFSRHASPEAVAACEHIFAGILGSDCVGQIADVIAG